MKIPRGRYFAKTSELLNLLINTIFSFNSSTDEINLSIEALTKKNLTNNQSFIFSPSFRIGLYYALSAIKKIYPDRKRIVTTSITIPDTINAIRLNQLQELFIEMDEETHGIDIQNAKECLDSDVLAIIVTHLSGSIDPELSSLYKYCKDRNIFVIEDFSQAYGNEHCFKFADISIGSLSTGKTASTLIGGIITTKDQYILNEIKNEKSKNEDRNKVQKSMIIFQIIDSLKINFFCNRYIFSFATYYALRIFKILFPSSYSKLEQARTITRAINQDRFFENSFTHREAFPSFFFFSLSKGQLSLYMKMLKRLISGNRKRREILELYLNLLSEDSKKAIPKNFLTLENNTYYHIPIKTYGKRDLIQNLFFKNGVDISSYGLPLCHSYFSETNKQISERIKYDTLFIPINEFSTDDDVKKIANVTNKIYMQLKEISVISRAPLSGNAN
ncbi:DegT/DnrJ/EryC1/StrS family aminotransferase [Bacteriovorax sp. Seq25_V]|uniref:DegT/DnrJ/EryC1/StrS family aminotransferase n=1 Tax=Bacteriovorax sp. Seq25_V TaxID=1201288 RepID=UPI0005581224|nr:DegT/DnrJ/EryC1/StrS family aminotransferase [Bacteriovorax sp. Seq25_V]